MDENFELPTKHDMLQHILDMFACNDDKKQACDCERELVSKSL
jgi:hypothetical protein